MSYNIHPCLWFDQNAEEAANYYVSIFPNSKIVSKNNLVVHFELDSRLFMALNGGPVFHFNESVSFVAQCENQEEIDHLWNSLTAEGKESQCGWLKDKYGVSWQIVPKILGSLMSDPEKAPKVIEKFLKMKKFIIADLME